MRLESLTPTSLSASRADLIALLQVCVHGGASIGFLSPLDAEEAGQYWDSLAPSLAADGRTILVARDEGGRVIGSGQLAFESRKNGRHRAEVCKVMVLPSHRGQRIAARLMADLEALARARAVRLLFLDTSEGTGGARAFYERLGYTYVGGIPDYAVNPDGTAATNAIFYKQL